MFAWAWKDNLRHISYDARPHRVPNDGRLLEDWLNGFTVKTLLFRIILSEDEDHASRVVELLLGADWWLLHNNIVGEECVVEEDDKAEEENSLI